MLGESNLNMWIVMYYLLDHVSVFLVEGCAVLPTSKREPITLLLRPRQIVMEGIPIPSFPSAADMPAKSVIERANEVLERLSG